MTFKTLAARVSMLMLFAAALAACSTTKQAAAPAVRTIAVIPAVDPDWYSLRNRNAASLVVSPLIDVANAIDSRSKAEAFTAKMLELNTHLGGQLTRAVVDALNAQGFQAKVVPQGELKGVDLRDIDYGNFKTAADAVLHVYVTDIGVYSGYSTLDYLPKANVTGYLFNPRDGSYIHEETIYYGADGREGKTWSVSADPKYAYRSFEDLMNRAPELAKSFDEGSRAVAGRMAENFRKALR